MANLKIVMQHFSGIRQHQNFGTLTKAEARKLRALLRILKSGDTATVATPLRSGQLAEVLHNKLELTV